MNTPRRRGIRAAVVSLGFAGVFVAFNAIQGAATPSVGYTNLTLGRGTFTGHGSLSFGHGLDILVSKITLGQPGTSGWHSHPGGAIVMVQQGEITLYRSVGKGEDDRGQSQSNEERGGRSPRCVITKYTIGQAFVERPGEVVDAVNTGSTDVTLVAVFPGVPVGVVGGQRIDQPNPGTCGI
jgi:hypothetical protein